MAAPNPSRPVSKHMSTASTLADFSLSDPNDKIVEKQHEVAVSIQAKSTDSEAAGSGDSLTEWKPQRSEWLIMITLSILSTMVALDATILVSALPTIALDLHGSAFNAFWAGTSYLLSNAICQPVIASVSEAFGRQQLLLASLTFFTLGTALCAGAHNFTVLLAGRGIQGVGSAGIITLAQCIFCDIVPLRQRPRLFSIVLGGWAIGSITGPVIGGAIAQHTSWRWIFIINFPFCGLGYICTIFLIKIRAVVPLTFIEKLRHTDWMGAFLFIGSMTSLLVGLSWGGVQYAWISAATLATLIAGAIGLVVFLVWQLKIAKFPIIKASIFYCASSFAAFYCAAINGLLLFTACYYLPFYYSTVRGHSFTRSGVDIVPGLVCFLPGSIIVSLLTTRTGKFRWAIWLGWLIATVGTGLLILLDEKNPSWVGIVALAIFGLGSGMVLSGTNFGIQAISHIEDCAMSASMYGFFRSLGMPIGVATAGNIFQSTMRTKLVSLGLPAKIAKDAEGFVFTLRKLQHDDPTRVRAIEAYSHGFRSVFIFMTVMAGTALISSLFIRRFSLDKILHSNFTARTEEEDMESKQ